MKKFGTIPWYLNTEKIVSLLRINSSSMQQIASVPGKYHISDPEQVARKKIQLVLEEHTVKNKVPTLHDLAPDKLEPGRMFTLYHDFYCIGTSDICASELADIPITKMAMLHKKIYLKRSTKTNIEIKYSPRHITTGSSFCWLSGHKKLFVVAIIISSTKNTIEATPLLIGSVGDGILYDGPDWFASNSYGELKISQIDQFNKYSKWIKENPGGLIKESVEKVMRNLTEKRIKEYFAEIIGEPHIEKDWGGEKSDLFSGRLFVESRQLSAAFMFKGPGKYKDLKCSDLGKNGDQIDRMFSEPSKLCVLQHCHTISTAVRSQMKAYATRVHDLRNYLIIDGADTYALFKAYRKI